MHVRRTLALLTVPLLAAGAALGTTAASAAGTGVCALTGTAHISPGLKTAKQSFSYTFTGRFTGCTSTEDKTVKSGSVSASGHGSGSCASTKTSGAALVSWNNGKSSAISFTTTGAGAALEVVGKFTSGEFAGENAKAVLNFVANPGLCATSGAATLPFYGAGELGH
jgi:hypothetical protein